jgi:VanZ family protein
VLLAAYWLALLAATHVPWRVARRIEHADKVGHFVAYAILAALLYGTGRLVFRSSAWMIAAIFVLVAAYATADEWLQTFVPPRTADFYDWCADLAGAAFTLAVCVVLRRKVF